MLYNRLNIVNDFLLDFRGRPVMHRLIATNNNNLTSASSSEQSGISLELNANNKKNKLIRMVVVS